MFVARTCNRSDWHLQELVGSGDDEPMIEHTNRPSWSALLHRLGLSDPDGQTFDKLVAAYSGPGRHYHSLAHIEDCLVQLQTCGLPQDRADLIALAFWFHDAIYNWRSATNEADSATWASEFLSDCAASTKVMNNIHSLVMATCHFVPETPVGDCALMVDIDLSILGRDTAAYDRYEQAIRLEYWRVPQVTYRRERRKVLRSFVDREQIYLTDRFRSLYEVQARQNLKRAIRML